MKRYNLNKENFWNRIEGKFPQVSKHFFEWVDKWKEVNETNTWVSYVVAKPIKSVKFHDYPYEMQFGIFGQYLTEIGILDPEFGYFTVNLDEYIEDTFEKIELKLCQ